ncbi:MAG: hypothetical protein NTW09_04930 [Candidatus Omnitrophica bacterium]|nr:hypothetical protein [Candidatus Omnitrophota bacterium]
MQKTRYELDPYNRLILRESRAGSDLTKFRQVLDGRFRIDGGGLSYHVKAPLPEGEKIPHQIRLKGEWSLTDDHNLRLTLDKSARKTFGDRITLEGEVLDVNANSLLFAVTTIAKENTRSTYILNLDGSWKADKFNRLSFHAKKEKGRYDILTLNGAWEVNENHEIIYQYEKADLITKKKRTHTLTFKGHWDISKKGRISYLLGGGTDSLFDFMVSAGIFQEENIKYEVGIGLTNRVRPMTKTVSLFGKWNLKKDAGLVFEIQYDDRKTGRIIFGADARLTDRDTVSFRLKSGLTNDDIGVELELGRDILKGGGEAFLRALASRRESAVYAGAAWRW